MRLVIAKTVQFIQTGYVLPVNQSKVFVDQNEDGIINQDDLYKGKSSIPKVFFGFSTSVNYKKWSAGFVLRASFNNYVYNNNYSQAGVQNQILEFCSL
jgi:iron complex outermembrane receptor protein